MASVKIDKEACKGCGLCVHVCPKGILALDSSTINRKGYSPAHCTDMRKCNGCMSCARMCPDVCIEVER